MGTRVTQLQADRCNRLGIGVVAAVACTIMAETKSSFIIIFRQSHNIPNSTNKEDIDFQSWRQSSLFSMVSVPFQSPQAP